MVNAISKARFNRTDLILGFVFFLWALAGLYVLAHYEPWMHFAPT